MQRINPSDAIAMASGNLKHAQNIRFKNIPEMVQINKTSKIIVNVIILIPPLLISISIGCLSDKDMIVQQKQVINEYINKIEWVNWYITANIVTPLYS